MEKREYRDHRTMSKLTDKYTKVSWSDLTFEKPSSEPKDTCTLNDTHMDTCALLVYHCFNQKRIKTFTTTRTLKL